jgi:hypothetical protein
MEVGVQTDPPGRKTLSEATRRKMGDARRGVPRDPAIMKKVVETKRRLRELYTAEQLAERSRQAIPRDPEVIKRAAEAKKLLRRGQLTPEQLHRRASSDRAYLRLLEKEKENFLAAWKASYEANKQKEAANEIIQLNSQQVIVAH